ncbi:MAG: M23 family metallopeptidase [Campylobacterales bacterium]|nr:M23 family metallopeptidase [Campylobacterales bacterium]
MGEIIKDQTVITITNIKGSRSYTIDQVVKKYIRYILSFAMAFFILSMFVIYFLVGEKEAYDNLKTKYKDLIMTNSDLEISINRKKNELETITSKIETIETMVGIKAMDNLENEQRLDVAAISAKERMLMFRNIPSGKPLDKIVITSKYGWRENPLRPGRREFHPGIDLRAPVGTPVYATADGIVKQSRVHNKWNRKGYGKLLIIDHNLGFETLYGHLNKIVVKAGQFVKKGDVVAYTGNTGFSSGPHLHYEVRYIMMTLEPINFIYWSHKNYDAIFQKEKRARWKSLTKGIKWQSILLEQQSSPKEQK